MRGDQLVGQALDDGGVGHAATLADGRQRVVPGASIDIPARCRTLRVAGIGPLSIMTGSEPTWVKPTNRARGRKPSSSAFSRDAISTAAAPSEIWLELPAVKNSSPSKAGFNVASRSTDVSARMP